MMATTDGPLQALAKHGPWAVMFGVLLGFFLWEVRPAIADLRAEHQEMRVEDRAEAEEIKNVYGQVLMALERSNYLERRNCINTARTQVDRDACAKDRD